MAKRRSEQSFLPGMGPGDGDPPDSTGDPSPEAGSSERVVEATTPPPSAVASSPASGASSPAPPSANQASSHPAETEPPDLTGKSVWVIDANSLIYQTFHAIPEMTSPTGLPVNAVFGFTRDLFTILDQKRPTYLFCAFDPPGPTFRHELAADYKATRSETPDDLRPQFPLIHRVLDAMGIPVLEVAGYEADDVLATLARITEERGGECYLVTGDKDCRQLISPRVRVYNIRKNLEYDEKSLHEDWGIRPEQVVDFQALVGDSVDNIAGIPLVGPKVAGDWLSKYQTLDELLRRAEELPKGKRKENLIAGAERVKVSRELARLDKHVPVPIEWPAGRAGQFRREPMISIFDELRFRSLAERARSLPVGAPPTDAAGQADTAASAPSEMEPTADDAVSARGDGVLPVPAHAPALAGRPVRYITIDSPDALHRFVNELAQQKRVSIDTETTHIWPTWAELVGLSFAWQDDVAYYIPVKAPPGEPQLDVRLVLEKLRPALEDPAIEKIGQNLKYDMIVLAEAGVTVRGLGCDTMIADYLLVAGERNHNLDDLATRYLNHTTIKISELIGTGSKQKRMDEVPVALVTDYAAEDALVAWRLTPLVEQRLAEEELSQLNRDVELPLVEVLVALERAGIRVDTDRLRQLSQRFQGQMEKLQREIFELAGHEFNIASPKQLQKVLFDELKLPVVKRTATGPSTDQEVLDDLARLHPLPAKIVEYRQYAKLRGTYVDALPEMVHPRTGRVHACFNQVVAATGRLSCNDPNLQNIPIRTQVGREIRSAFRPGPDGWKLLAADYSQIELRVLAHFSGDAALKEAFARDEDIHARVAAQVHNVPLADVTDEMRRRAKAVNFGVIYGQSAFGLAKSLGIEKAAAAAFIEAYFARYPGVDAFLTATLEACLRNGYVKTILGRKRAISGVRPTEGHQSGQSYQSGQGHQSGQGAAARGRNLPERTAINTVIQGSAADLIKLAMLAIHRRLAQECRAARMLLQVHDELIFELPPEEVPEVAQLVTEEMSSVLKLSVPLKVDVTVGPTWADQDSLS